MNPPQIRRTAALVSCGVLVVAAGATLRPRQAALEPAEELRWRETARIGTSDEKGPVAFGVIGDLLSDGKDRIFALDVVNKRIVTLSTTGTVPKVFGREGRGPGEFADPVALASDGARLYVLDRANQRIDVLSAEAALVRLGSFAPDFPAEDMCVLEDRLFVLGERQGWLIHELDRSRGRVLRSFARDTAAADLLLTSYRASGYLLCGPGDELTFLPMLRPDVQRFSASTGALLGVADIPGYLPVRVRRLSNRSVQFYARRGEHDFASAIVPLPDGGRLIQVGRLRRGATTRHEFESLRSYEISARDYQIREIAAPLPRILATYGTTALAAVTDPYPAVRVLNLTPRRKGSHER